MCAASHGVARRASAHRLSRAERREVSGAFVGLSQPRWHLASGISAGDDHALAAGRTGLWTSDAEAQRGIASPTQPKEGWGGAPSEDDSESMTAKRTR